MSQYQAERFAEKLQELSDIITQARQDYDATRCAESAALIMGNHLKQMEIAIGIRQPDPEPVTSDEFPF